MPRITLVEWWCWRNHRNDGSVSVCQECGAPRREKHAQVHASERAVVFLDPKTGAHITPARADEPMPDVYRARGYQRHEILSMTHWERQSGAVHEATNFLPGNEPAPSGEFTPPQISKEVKEALVEDMRDAMASGPWTGGDNLE